MRGFFFLLLLSNVAFFGWQYYLQRADNESPNVYRDIAMVSHGLTLINELPEGDRPAIRGSEDTAIMTDKPQASVNAEGSLEVMVPQEAESAPVSAEEQLTMQEQCYRVTNIEDKQQLDALRKWLQSAGASEVEQSQHQGTEINYWVLLPAYRNRKKANEAAEILTAKRVGDFFIVRSGENENAVSLGVFSTRERAELRYNQIVALKARLRSPRIEALELPVKRFQITFRLSSVEQLKRVNSHLQRMDISRAENISCK